MEAYYDLKAPDDYWRIDVLYWLIKQGRKQVVD